MDEKWIVRNEDKLRLCRKLQEGLYEFYQIHSFSTDGGMDKDEESFVIAHDLVRVADIDEKYICRFFEYDSLEDVKRKYGENWDMVYAEWYFTLGIDRWVKLLMVCSNPYMTWHEAMKIIRQMSGYMEQFTNKNHFYWSEKTKDLEWKRFYFLQNKQFL